MDKLRKALQQSLDEVIKTFEEQFPSLMKDKEANIIRPFLGKNTDGKGSFKKTSLIRCCIDKQRLKNIIFKGDIRGFEKEIVEEIIKEFNLVK